MKKNVETLKNVELSKKWVVVLSKQGTTDIHEGLLGKIIISLPFEKKEIADLICRCFNAHDILVKQRDDLLEACELGLNSMKGLLEIGVAIRASNENKRLQANNIKKVEGTIAKATKGNKL